MTILFIVLIVVIVAVTSLIPNEKNWGKRAKYQYTRKDFFMSRAEHECYDALVTAVGDKYLIFAQVHLPTIVGSRVVGQNWNGAFRHISQKSVDFVLCDKAYISPKLAIELDDRTHQCEDRIERDGEVERILKGAGLPLLRLENHGKFDASELLQKIDNFLTTNSDKSGKSTPIIESRK